MSAARKVVAICVDDVGLVEGAAEAALALGEQGRISAASCVTTTPRWPGDARTLAASDRPRDAARIELGLHFNLTEGAPLSASLRSRWSRFPGLGRSMVMSHLGTLPLPRIADEWRAQLDAFVQAVGRAPDFVDGHQHVHHLPGVRDIVLDGVATLEPRPAVRSTGKLGGRRARFKQRVIESSGGAALANELDRRGLRRNDLLLGAYDFDAADYGSLMRDWLVEATPNGTLLFCHPSTGAAAGDPIASARRREADYLAGAAFATDLERFGVSVGSAWLAGRSSSAD